MMDHLLRGILKAIAMAIWAHRGRTGDNRIASLTDFVARGIGRDSSGGCGAAGMCGFSHGGYEKSGTGGPVRLFLQVLRRKRPAGPSGDAGQCLGGFAFQVGRLVRVDDIMFGGLVDDG